MSSLVEAGVTLDDIRAAAARIAPYVHRTAVKSCRSVDARTGGRVFFKCENEQRVGAFKFRGAMNALLQLDSRAAQAGVVTHSSGNHAQALACAGGMLGIPVCVVMPRTAPAVKKAATEGYGARVVPCEPTLAAREGTVAELIDRHGYTLVHPYDNWHVIAGAGTAALELLEQTGPLDAVIAPIGGGGLISGTATAVKGLSPATKVLGAEPAAADDALRSLRLGSIQPSNDPKTIADGLRTSLGERPWRVIREKVDDILTASEGEILESLRFLMERTKMVVEPSSAVPVAPIYTRAYPVEGQRIGVIISGGNLDLGPLFESLAAR